MPGSPLPVKVDLQMYHGDTWSQKFRLLDGAVPHDLTAATVESSVRDKAGTLIPLAIDLSGPGEVIISNPTPGLPVGMYDYDVEVTDSAGILTWVKGKLYIGNDVTNSNVNV